MIHKHSRDRARSSNRGAFRSQAVRIFLSSTFGDFGEGRDLLVKNVCPAQRSGQMAFAAINALVLMIQPERKDS